MSTVPKEGSVLVWTDGGCRPNPGKGGWGVLIRGSHGEEELWGGEKQTTNNRMELTAAIRALDNIPEGNVVTLHTDSQYVRNGVTKWIYGWRRRNWITFTGEPVANVDLWKQLDLVTKKNKVVWRWVKGHSGIPENERVDELATRGLREQ